MADTSFQGMTGLPILVQAKVSTLSANTCPPCLRANTGQVGRTNVAAVGSGRDLFSLCVISNLF